MRIAGTPPAANPSVNVDATPADGGNAGHAKQTQTLGGGEAGKLPSEQPGAVAGAPAGPAGAAGMERAFDAAAVDMDRGIKAQKAMKGGKKRGAAEEEDEELDATGDVASGVQKAKGVAGLDESWDNWDAAGAAKPGAT